MKKTLIIILGLCLFFSSNVYAADRKLIDIRDKIFEESKQINTLLSKSNDAVLLISMFDSCVVAISQIDAYISMLGVYESIKNGTATKGTFDLLSNWLVVIKNTNSLNIGKLNDQKQVTDPLTKTYIERLKGYFAILNNQVNTELGKINALKASARIK